MTGKKLLLLFVVSLFLSDYLLGQGSTGAKTGTGEEKIQQLIKKLVDSQEGPGRADIFNELSSAYRTIDPGKALHYANQGLEISKKIDYRIGIADGFNNIGSIYWRQGNYTQAMEYSHKGLKTSEEIGYKRGIALSYNNIGSIYRSQGNYSQALEYTHKSLKISEEIGDKKGIAASDRIIGIIYWSEGNYSQALEYSHKSLKISEELKDKKGISASYTYIAMIYDKQGNYSQALEYYLKGLQIDEELGDKAGIASSYNNIGIFYKKQENYHQALEYYFKGLKLKEELGDKMGIALAYGNIGSIYYKQGTYNQALEYYLKSLQITEEIGYKTGIALNLSDIAAIYFEQKQYDRALAVFLRSKKMNEEIGEKPELAVACLGIGKCYEMNGQYREAADHLNRALKIAQDSNISETIRDAAGELAEVYAKIAQYEKAYQFHVLFKEKSDFLKNEENTKKITRLEMQYEFDKKQKQQQAEQEKKDIAKEAELKRQRLLKYTFSGLAILLALLFYTRYRLKVKVNRQLTKEIRDREHAEAELVKSMKMETVGILSAGIAHDFNNLLTIIAGNLELAKYVLRDPDPQPLPLIENAEKATAQAAELVKKFLTLSEGGWMMRSKVNLPDIIKNAMASSPVLSQIPLSLSVPGDLEPLYGDERQLRQVMANLLLNAHEATAGPDKEKKIELSAENMILPADNQWKLREGEYVKISVTDNGKGIPKDLLPKIYDPYFSTKERGTQKGMGMGLAVSDAIVRKHAGTISVRSVLHEGTTFDLYLPVFKEAVKNVNFEESEVL